MADYEELRQRHVQEYFASVPGHIARLSWSAEQLRTERQARLRELLLLAKERSPWHARRLKGVDTETMTEDRIGDLPVMTKDDLMANFDEIVTEPRITLDLANEHLRTVTRDTYILDRYHIVASGGSSGMRGVFVWDWDAWTACQAAVTRYFMRDRMLDPAFAEVPMSFGLVAAEDPVHFTSALPQTFANPLQEVHRFPVSLPIHDIVDGLNRAQPSFLGAYASVLAALAAEAVAGRLTIRPVRVISTSEPLSPELRATVERTWNAPVANLWGTSEGGMTATGCSHGDGMHLTEDLLIVEPVDEAGHPVAAGIRSAKVYLTNLINHALPLIRYELTDEVTMLDEPCPCGSPHRRVADIQGRLDDTFVYEGGVRVHPYTFWTAADKEPGVIEFQVIQTPDGAEVLFRADRGLDTDRIARSLEEELRRLGLPDARVRVRLVEAIERQATGKLKRFVPLASAAGR